MLHGAGVQLCGLLRWFDRLSMGKIAKTVTFVLACLLIVLRATLCLYEVSLHANIRLTSTAKAVHLPGVRVLTPKSKQAGGRLLVQVCPSQGQAGLALPKAVPQYLCDSLQPHAASFHRVVSQDGQGAHCQARSRPPGRQLL